MYKKTKNIHNKIQRKLFQRVTRAVEQQNA